MQGLARLALIVGFDLRMHEDSDRADQPTLPFVRNDDGEALDFLLVFFYEASMIFESGDILPAIESGSINKQPDFPTLTDERIDLRHNLVEVVSLQFIRRDDLQCVSPDKLCLDHIKTP